MPLLRNGLVNGSQSHNKYINADNIHELHQCLVVHWLALLPYSCKKGCGFESNQVVAFLCMGPCMFSLYLFGFPSGVLVS